MRNSAVRLLISVVAASLIECAGAQSYPAKPIHVVVPYPAGGTTDVLARAVGEKLTAKWGQPIVVDNRAGAGGLIGTEAAARAAADGYTLILGNNQTHSANAALFEKVPFDLLRDFAPVAIAATSRHVVVVPTASPARSIRQLIALGQNGGKLSYASSSAGSASHLISEMLRIRNAMDAVHVPYKGAGPAVTDLLGGQVNFMTATYAAVAQHIESGKLRALAIGGAARIPSIGSVPTLAEEGFPDLNADAWFAFYAPAGTPAAIVEALNAEINRAVEDPAVATKLRAIGFEPVTMSVPGFTQFHRSELARWSEIVKASGARLTQ